MKPAPCSKRQPSENVRLPPGDRGPGATAAAAPGGLPFGGEQRAVDVAARRATQELARRGIDLVDDFDGDRRLDAE